MFGAPTPYVVAICTLLFCGVSALTLFTVVEHFDPPDAGRVRPETDVVGVRALTDRVAV